MCGIVGLFLKNDELKPRLGSMFAPMLVEMSERGPDSAGVAVYRDEAEGMSKITAWHPDARFDWNSLCLAMRKELDALAVDRPNDTHHVILTDAPAVEAAEFVESFDPDINLKSIGRAMEIYKETGLPQDVVSRFGIDRMSGSHAVGHTRMATESAVTTAGSHPFSTGPDICLVHNGSLSNHNRLRVRLKREGMRFKTDNDTEVAAAYVAWRLGAGRSLKEALEDCLEDLDGFYTFVAGIDDGFAVLRDPIACKPAVLAETDDFVAFGSEYRALASLPEIRTAKVWEPEPGIVYSWGAR